MPITPTSEPTRLRETAKRLHLMARAYDLNAHYAASATAEAAWSNASWEADRIALAMSAAADAIEAWNGVRLPLEMPGRVEGGVRA